MKAFRIFLALLFSTMHFLLPILIICPSNLNARMVLSTQYETGSENDENPEIGVVEAYSDRIEASQSYARTGNWSLRTELRYGDSTSAGCRAECNTRFAGAEPIIERGVLKYYGFSLLLYPDNYAYDDNGDIIFQVKQSDSEPSFHLMTDEGKFKYNYQNAGTSNVYNYFTTYQKGIWYDFVLELLPQYTSNGYMKLCYKKAIDSSYTKVLDYTGSTLLNDRDGYIKWGVYKSTWCDSATMSNIRVIYHDNINVATTFAEADPACNSTAPMGPFANIIYPSSYTVMQGNYFFGNIGSLLADDNDNLIISSLTSGTTRYATTDFTLTDIPSGTFSEFDVKAVIKSSGSGTAQKIYLYNYTTAAWEQKDSTTISTNEVTRNISVIGGNSKYIKHGQMKILIECSLNSSFTVSHEIISVTLIPLIGDINADGIVNFKDFALLAYNWFKVN